ncbi:hypothetical protein BDW68DRAFT_169825 [Aspergillus falconensis]
MEVREMSRFNLNLTSATIHAMSGIEVAGLALASLPLLVNQLDNYPFGMETEGSTAADGICGPPGNACVLRWLRYSEQNPYWLNIH